MGKTISRKDDRQSSKSGGSDSRAILYGSGCDRAMMDDILGLRIQIAEQLKELGKPVWDPEKVVIISDHYTPPASIQQAEIVKFTREWARRKRHTELL